MLFLRRQLLRTLSFAFGSSFILGRNQLAIAAQTAVQPKTSSSPCGGRCSRCGRWRSGNGKSDRNRRILLSSQRSESVGALVPAALGISLIPSSEGIPFGSKRAGPTAFAPFPETSKYFGDAQKVWMLNFRVRDLDKMAAQLRAAGSRSRFTRPIPPAGLPACMTLREIRSKSSTVKRKLARTSPGLF